MNGENKPVMKDKILIIVHLGRHLRLFSHSDAEIYYDLGYEVHFAANFNWDEVDRPRPIDKEKYTLHQINFSRSPFSLGNFKAFLQLRKLVRKYRFRFIHTHMAIAGLVGRLVAKNIRQLKVIHTSHGFAFYHGLVWYKYSLFSTIERLLAHHTDYLITMNNQDYLYAQKRMKLRAEGRIIRIPGVGFDLEKSKTLVVDRRSKRESIGVNESSYLVVTTGELSKRKNQMTAIKAISLIQDKRVVLVICGKGILLPKLQKLVQKLEIQDYVKFLGFRSDIIEILKVSDLFLFPSLAEGLPISLLEAMGCGLPVVASFVRGNEDLVKENINGFLVEPFDYHSMSRKIEFLMNNKLESDRISCNNKMMSMQYDKKDVCREIKNHYLSIID